VLVGDKNINVLMYADDIILLATSRMELQILCKTAENWANFHKLKIHPGKTEYIIRGRQSQVPIKVAGATIRPRNGTKYLGEVNSSKDRKAHAKSRVK
jgi:hypothetical protein